VRPARRAFDEFGAAYFPPPGWRPGRPPGGVGGLFASVRDCQIAENENFRDGWGRLRSGIDLEAAGAIGFGVETLGYFSGVREWRGDAAGPEDGARGDGCRRFPP